MRQLSPAEVARVRDTLSRARLSRASLSELGAAHEGVHGAWEHLPEPDVARFVPDGD